MKGYMFPMFLAYTKKICKNFCYSKSYKISGFVIDAKNGTTELITINSIMPLKIITNKVIINCLFLF